MTLGDSERVYDVPAEWAKRAWIDEAKYREMYARSLSDPKGFWAEQAKRLDWMKAPTKIDNWSFAPGNISIKWFEDGVLNAAYNCIDRHLHKRGEQTAIIWEGDDPSQSKHITYRQLHDEVCRMANILRNRNVKKGDRVTIYLPMIPEVAYAILACARIGAIHSVVFAGFSPDSLAQRINDCKSKVVITADEGLRGGRKVPLKANVDEALGKTEGVDWVIVVRHTGAKVDMKLSRDLWYHEAAAMVTTECPCEHMHAEDPLFILYTSGSTGQPKGVLHTTAGYLVYTAMTHQYVFDYHEADIYWCTADVGWVTGHSYILYAPLANGATTLMFEGVPNYPDTSRFWNVVDKHKVNIFYTAPTAIRALMQGGDEPVKKTSRKSLRLLGTVGEPINPEAWEWYHRVVGEDRCPIVDTWWQTETGGILITPLPGATRLKPGSATLPFFGVVPEIVDADGKVLEGEATGNLCITRSWPGQMRTVYGDHARFEQTYFSTYKGKYFTGDGCRRDADGYYWITGRVDDVINVSGHRMGTAEVESALVAHAVVSEAAVVGYPHDIKGQGIYAYVTLMAGMEPSEELRKELVAWVRKEIGPIASPDQIQVAPRLDLAFTMNNRRILIANLAKGTIGEQAANLLGSLLVSHMQLVAMERGGLAPERRVPFFAHVDEFQTFSSEAFATLLSEARKFATHFCLANQYTDQLSPSVRAAVIGNAGTLVVFRVGSRDAELLAPEFRPMDAGGLADQEPFTAWLRRGIGRNRIFAEPKLYEPLGTAELIREQSRQRFGRPRAAIERQRHLRL